MSIVTRAQPAIQDGAPTRLLSLPLALTFLAEFTSLTSFFLLLGTVIAEAAAAAGIRRFGYRTMLAAGAVLLGVPALALLPREPQAVMMGVSFDAQPLAGGPLRR